MRAIIEKKDIIRILFFYMGIRYVYLEVFFSFFFFSFCWWKSNIYRRANRDYTLTKRDKPISQDCTCRYAERRIRKKNKENMVVTPHLVIKSSQPLSSASSANAAQHILILCDTCNGGLRIGCLCMWCGAYI
ncbi:hypothetical protein AA313_de0204358 [Arthrobotrys entomopaga]|nr:hypothetical protein AA313_de0204358 [Arthrobotrys entomopaga]